MWAWLEGVVFSLWLEFLPPTKWHGYWLDGLLAHCTRKRKEAEKTIVEKEGSRE